MREFYGHTNESLWAIIAGMDVSRKDRVLCVCGSGDQAFALAQFAGEVLAVDRKKEQIDYAKRRLQALEDRNYVDFFPLSDEREKQFLERAKEEGMPSQELVPFHLLIAARGPEDSPLTWMGSVKYFLGESEPFTTPPYGFFFEGSRIPKIRENLHRISFFEGSIADVLKKDSDFSRVYLSNAHLFEHKSAEELEQFVALMSWVLPRECLVYTSNYSRNTIEFPSCWRLDEELSAKAKKLEVPSSWHPKVYRKVA